NTVKFNPASTDSLPTAYHTWTFGDGSPVSHNVSPTHTFAVGSYAVVHTIVRPGTNGTTQCSQSFTMQIVIQDCNLTVDFSWTQAAANPLSFAFTNLSTPLATNDSITWIFGDNTQSHDVNPTHTYANYGTYTVCLIVKKNVTANVSPCVKYTCKTITIIQPCNLVVDYSWSLTSTNPYTVAFTNLSTPLSSTDSITWTFGDGTSSTLVSPTHIYSQPGTYNVCLKVKKVTSATIAPCVREICKTVVVQNPCNLVVDFSWTSAAGNPLTLAFTNLSTPLAATDSITWTFGDGTSSHDVNPTHTYTAAGSYQVCLVVKKYPYAGTTACIRYICKTVVIQTPCTLVVDFGWQ
ncbi:MAG TPA: PKD domain-containing protein, partial [Ferruginibacter sp.]|nr:PKD domain-containing protein [Ferruginibacter sp.]